MPEFISIAISFNTTDGKTNGIIRNGLAGYFQGIPVYVSSLVMDSVNGSRTYFIKRDALAYIFQRGINVEVEREAKLFADVVITSTLYATKLLVPSGVSILGAI